MEPLNRIRKILRETRAADRAEYARLIAETKRIVREIKARDRTHPMKIWRPNGVGLDELG